MNLCRDRKNAFTLIELLVVVAIIAVLIALLLPSLNQARQSTKKLVCATQLKTIGQGLTFYTNEYFGWGPYRPKNITNLTQWTQTLNIKPYKLFQNGLLFKYVGGNGNEIIPPCFMCPEDVFFPNPSKFGVYTSYMLNPEVATGTDRTLKVENLPSDRTTLIDYCIWGNITYPIEENTNHQARGVNILRVDGRVNWVGIERMKMVPVWSFELLDNIR